MDQTEESAGDLSLSPEERSAIRAYLQRGEVRLSTMHRVATALLSGAGIMVLLPVVGRDAVVEVCRHLVTGELDAPKAVLAVAMLAALTVPILALVLVLRDLTEFYFHANHLTHPGGEAFVPRFTLTGLRLPVDELGPAAELSLERERRMPRAIELVVPDNDVARRRIDARVAAYGGLGYAEVTDDESRASALFALASSRPRTLLDEVAKVEHGMVRHVLRIQSIVLRYVKALLALLTTALAVFAGAAVVEGKVDLGPAEDAWLAGILLVWAPLVIAAAATPVRWLELQLRNEGATHTAVSQDRELTYVEDVTVRVALVAFVASAAVMVASLSDAEVTNMGRVVGAAVLIGAVVATRITVRSWIGAGGLGRLVGRS